MAAARQAKSDMLLESGLRELELLFRAVHQHSSQPVVLTDDDRKCLDSSFGLNKLVGLSRDQLMDRRLDDFVAPGFGPQLERQWAQFLDEGELADSCPLLLSGKRSGMWLGPASYLGNIYWSCGQESRPSPREKRSRTAASSPLG